MQRQNRWNDGILHAESRFTARTLGAPEESVDKWVNLWMNLYLTLRSVACLGIEPVRAARGTTRSAAGRGARETLAGPQTVEDSRKS